MLSHELGEPAGELRAELVESLELPLRLADAGEHGLGVMGGGRRLRLRGLLSGRRFHLRAQLLDRARFRS